MKNFSLGDKIPLPESSDEDEAFGTEINQQDEEELSDIEVEKSDYSDDEDDDDEADFNAKISSFYSNDEESDSDSAPEICSKENAKENEKQAQKVFAEAIRQQKADLKRKRKEILQRNLDQKEEKKKKIKPTKPINQEGESESLQDDKADDQQEKLKKKYEEDISATAGNVTFKCKILPVEAKKPRFIPEKVEHFKDRLLYGGRIRREKSNRDAVLKREKQRIKR